LFFAIFTFIFNLIYEHFIEKPNYNL